jgi:rSAM/selenodomain-associated transferase 2
MLSVVVPALNAGATIGPCLEQLTTANEILVVDGGSSDRSASIAAHAGATVIRAHRGRGVQLAAGAAAAKGDWLLFLHADTRLANGWPEAVDHHMATHSQQAACFRFQLDSTAWQARIVERGVALRVRLLGLPYGDQGLLISRELYDALGGYRALPLMEDVDLVRRIARRRLRVLDADAVTSAARWRRDGWLRRSARNLLCLALYLAGMSPARIVRLYG